MQPAAHMSSAGVWRGACSSSSGARYHNVTTRGVAQRAGAPSHRASPKSAKNESQHLLYQQHDQLLTYKTLVIRACQ